MHLKKLEMQGFKSFAEHTIVEFDEGMTAVVGPNGSGKSNITDAIRWVLGEQSVRTLRGGKMEDVIFNGTQSRKAMNYAEVSITLENEDGQLPIEYQEVQIARRLYRSGESEYLINKTNCRLKDVITLFMDTGLGKDGYSIIGQGRVDDILSGKSDDRRKILEEASGIVKYKVRRDEAQRKLLSTDQNLIRISDILGELQEQVAPLEEQAEKAQKYHRIFEEWTRLDMGLSLHLISKHNAFLESVDGDIEVLSSDVSQLEEEILKMREENRNTLEKQEQIRQKEEEIRRQTEQLMVLLHEKQRLIAISSDRREQLKSRISTDENQDENIDSGMRQIEDELSAQKKRQEALEKQRESYEQLLEEGESKMKALLSSLGEKETSIAAMRSQMEELKEEIFSQRENLSELSGELGGMQMQKKSFEQDKLLIIGESDALRIKKEDTEKACRNVQQKTEEIQVLLEEKTELLAEVREVLENISAQKISVQRELDQTQYRKNTLEELERSKEGFQEPVRKLMKAVGEDSELAGRIIGLVGELIQTHDRYETAIEIALGQNLHHVVSHTQRDAAALIRYLKENQMGRATFLPLDVMKSRQLEASYLEKIVSVEGFIGIASDLVTCPKEIQVIAKNLLGRIVIARDMGTAMKIAGSTGHYVRVVTLEGDVVNAGGSMTGGSLKKKVSGILGRNRLIDQLKSRKEELCKNIDQLEKEHSKKEEQLLFLAREQQKQDDLFREASLERVRIEENLDRLEADESRVKEQIHRMDEQNKALEQQIDNAKIRHREISERILQNETNLEKNKGLATAADEENKKAQSELDDIRSEVGDMRISVGSIEESIRGAKEIQERILKEKENYKESIIRRKKEREEAAMEILDLGERGKILEKELADLKEKEKEFQDSLYTLKNEEKVLQDSLGGFSDRLSDRTAKFTRLQNDMVKLETKKDSVLVTLDEIKNRMWEDHEKTTDDETMYRIEVKNESEMQRKISDLRGKMRALGNINFGAVEEYQRIRDRVEFITDQKKDVETAKKNLEEMIKELTDNMKEQFISHFRQINENFKLVFTDLFLGGTAEILLEDEEDILSCDIQIRAQPPGKKLQNLSLLSGGERCLTAIALLFSILRLRPAPFCVLDEVEAALDDVNITRFTDFVHRYTSNSQFILVTHRKGTMESCDRIYGVTMQERGISKILSMRLGDADAV